MAACRNCGIAISRKRWSGYCPDCLLLFCNKCRAPLPAGQIYRLCRSCHRLRKAKLLERDYQFCARCKQRIPARPSHYCRDCQRAIRNEVRWDPERRCRHCPERLPLGRWSDLCTACDKKRREKQLANRPQGTCNMCGTSFRRTMNSRSYCHPCNLLRRNWLYAYHQGDPGACGLRPVQKRDSGARKEES